MRRIDSVPGDGPVTLANHGEEWNMNKSTSVLPPFARRQILNFLKASTPQVGLILHFGPTAKFYRIIQTNRRPIDSGGVKAGIQE